MHNNLTQWWTAVLKRDHRFDGTFVYGVRSTGIYCRPACPSRRPSRTQVQFFERAGAAESAGFRPCRRCKPHDGASQQSKLVQAVCRYIEDNHAEPLTLAGLAIEMNVSPFYLQRVFKRALGVSPRQYADGLRVRSVKKSLRAGIDVTSALYDAGFGSSSRLYERTNGEFGMTPSTYGRGGRGMRIRYTIAGCPLGRLLVAATPRGVCTVSLGNSDAELLAMLRSEYAEADVARDAAALKSVVAKLLRHLNGAEPRVDLPLDIQATAFQRRVWEELRAIPYGATRSYAEIANAIGRPRAARAVARACATNPVALVIPCHRVVTQTGDTGGYRWGEERKRALLKKENNRK